MSSSEEEEFQGSSEEEEEEDDDSDVPLAKANEPESEDSDDSDDSDDIPLAALRAPTKKATTPAKVKTTTPTKKKGATTKESPAKKAVDVKKKKTTTKVTEAVSSTSTPAMSNHRSASAALYGSNCEKGLLIQRLLCRWWYAMTWPDGDAVQPPHYDTLDGMPGIFICTSGSNVGHILDTRDKETCPNFTNFAKKPAKDLQALLLKALETQRKALIQLEGVGSPSEKEINEIIKWTQKIKPDKADNEAIKVLKAAKLSLPG